MFIKRIIVFYKTSFNDWGKKLVLFLISAALLTVGLIAVSKIHKKINASSVKVREIPIYSVENNEKKVSITFDCAWGAEDIPIILTTLSEKNVKATFFVVGEWARRNPEETKMIAEQGHDIANHSENHFKMSALGTEKMKAEILDCTKTIEEITGKRTDLFRVPYGDYNDTVVKTAKELGYYTIQWDVDSLDWKVGISQESIKERISNRVLEGSILLFHNDTPHTSKILGEIIDMLFEKGYKIVPISELILRDNYTIRYDGRQIPKGK